jgi:predicted amidophosphoribosyltransferase
VDDDPAFGTPAVDATSDAANSGAAVCSQPPATALFCMSGDWSDGDPFAGGSALAEVAFTPPTGALADNTIYWWRARASDPAGGNSFGAWSAPRSYATASAVADERWQQTSQAQFNLDTVAGPQVTANGGGAVELAGATVGTTTGISLTYWNPAYTDVSSTYVIPVTGRITQWSVRKYDTAGGDLSGKVNIYGDDGTNLIFKAAGATQTITGAAGVYTFADSIPVTSGDLVGYYASSGRSSVASCTCTTWDKSGDQTGTSAKSTWLVESNYAITVQVTVAPDPGSVTSTPVLFSDGPASKTSWGSVSWAADTSGGTVSVAAQRWTGAAWAWTGLQASASPLSISSLGKEAQIRLVANLSYTSVAPKLFDWEVSWTGGATGPTASLAAPNGGEVLTGGSGFNVQWTAAQGTNPIHPSGISIYFSSAGSAGPWQMAKGNLGNSGAYTWQVPQVNTTAGFMRVCARDDQVNALFACDDSNGPFTIQPGNAAPFLQADWPRAGTIVSGVSTFRWNASDVNSDRVDYQLLLSPDGGTTWRPGPAVSYNETPSPMPRSLGVDTRQHPDGANYRWRVQGTDQSGAVSNDTSTGAFVVDNGPPATSMGPLPAYSNSTTFTITYNGSDAGSGLAGIDIEVATDGGARTPLYSNATNNSAGFTGQEGHFYEFYSLGWDRAGNREAKSAPDAKTTIDFTAPTSRVDVMPPYVASLTFDVPFIVSDASGTDTTVHWRSAGGAWQPSTPVHVNQGQSSGKSRLTVPAEGEYEFYSTARDDAGHTEAKTPAMEAKTIVDSKPPAVTASIADTLLTCAERLSVLTEASDNLALARLVLEVRPSDGSAPWKEVLNRSVSGPVYSGPLDAQFAGAKDGKHLVRVTAIDGSGQKATSAEIEVTFDCVKPSVASTTPAPGAAGVPLEGPFKLTFSEPMNVSSVDKALKIVGGGGTATFAGKNWSGNEVVLDIAGLEGNSTYTITVSTDAADLSGNKLNASKEVRFATIPTHGVMVGTVRDQAGAVVKNAVVKLSSGSEVVVANVSKEGSFRVESLRAGTWTVRAEAKGYLAVETSVEVVAAQERRADIVLEKDQMPVLIGTLVGAIALLVVLGLAIRLMAKKCPRCKAKLPKSANACPACGHVVRQKSKLDLQREAREARDAHVLAEQRAAAAAAPKPKKQEKKKPAAAPSPAVPQAAPPALAVQKPRPTNCFACGAALKGDDDWCPKCGQAIGAAEAVDTCRSCGGAALDGVCINCGATLPEIDETSVAEGPACPRCMAPLAPGSGFCDQCGFSILPTGSQAGSREGPAGAAAGHRPIPTSAPPAPLQAPERAAAQPPPKIPSPAPLAPSSPSGPVPPPEPSAPSVAPSSGAAPPGTSLPPAAAGMVFCPTCGSTVPKDMVICDVCGEAMKR